MNRSRAIENYTIFMLFVPLIAGFRKNVIFSSAVLMEHILETAEILQELLLVCTVAFEEGKQE